jgi:hypothetical protein
MTDLEAADRLTFETGILAGRLRAFLDRVLAESRGADGREFLQSAYAAAAAGRPIDTFTRDPLSRSDPHDPLARLARALGLTPLDAELCLLAGMPEEHEGFAAVFRSLHPRGEPRPTAALAAQLFCGPGLDRHALRTALEAGAATAGGAVRLTGDAPFFERSMVLADGLWSALSGINAWPAGLARIEAPIVLDGLEEWLGGPSAQRAIAAIRRAERCTVLVSGDSDELAFQRSIALVASAKRTPAGFAWPANPDAGLEPMLSVHSVARGVVPVVRMSSADGPGAAGEPPSFAAFGDTAVVAGRTGGLAIRSSRPLIAVTAERLSSRARRRMWSAMLPALQDHSSALAARFPLEPAAAAAVVKDMHAIQVIESRSPTLEDAAGIVRARAGLGLSTGVRLLTPSARWDDLVLPPDRVAQLREACSRLILQDRVLDDWGFLSNRPGARGVRMLFSGPPGTGKTLAAEVIARALSVDLLYVDISRIVSKWIGETEKNLASIFETAERAQAVLFFDEADALFGKRTEVADAHDRYANLETAYLLSRLEQFEGLTILATNLRQNIDPAFIRRLEFSIDFEAPDRDERLLLWQIHVPRTAPLAADVDLGELAAHPVVGAFIRNAAVAAGFLAAGNGGEIGRAHFMHAIRREYEKSGRAFPSSANSFVHA